MPRALTPECWAALGPAAAWLAAAARQCRGHGLLQSAFSECTRRATYERVRCLPACKLVNCEFCLCWNKRCCCARSHWDAVLILTMYCAHKMSLCVQLGHAGVRGCAKARSKRAQTRALFVQPFPVLDTVQHVVGLALAVGLVRSWKQVAAQ